LFDNDLGILTYKRLELLVVGSVLGNQFDLISRNIARESFTAFTALQIIVGPMRSLADSAKLSGFHSLDLSDLLKQLRSSGFVHFVKYILLYIFDH